MAGGLKQGGGKPPKKKEEAKNRRSSLLEQELLIKDFAGGLEEAANDPNAAGAKTPTRKASTPVRFEEPEERDVGADALTRFNTSGEHPLPSAAQQCTSVRRDAPPARMFASESTSTLARRMVCAL